MHSINNCMYGRRSTSCSQGCCLTVVWKRCRDGALPKCWLCFHASCLPCLHTFCHAIPTSFYILMFFFIFHTFWSQLQHRYKTHLWLQLDLTLTSLVSCRFSFTWNWQLCSGNCMNTLALLRLWVDYSLAKWPVSYLWHKPWYYEKRPCQPYSARHFTCALVTLPDQWLWSLVWEQDYVCACVQHLKMASYATDSNRAELRTVLSTRVNL